MKVIAALTCHADDKALPLVKAELGHEGTYPLVDVGQAALRLCDCQPTGGQGWAGHGCPVYAIEVHHISTPGWRTQHVRDMLEAV